MAKLSLQDVAAGYQTPARQNQNNDLIEAALENTLSRNGASPNQMDAVLDMNSNRIVNLPDPVAATDAVRKDYVDGIAFGTPTSLHLPGGTVFAPSYSFELDGDTGIWSSIGNEVDIACGGTLVASFALLSGNPQQFMPNGTAAAPSYAFTNNINLGMYRATTNRLGFTTGGASRLLIDTTFIESSLVFGTVDGSPSTPGFYFASDPDTGIYRVSPNQIGFSTGGALRMSLANDSLAFQSSLLTMLGSDGTASNPFYSFANDGDNGMYRSTTNTVSISAGGSQGFAVDTTSVYARAGAVTTPAYSFLTDTNTGIYSSGSDQIGFATNGLFATAIDNSQNWRGGDGSVASPHYSFNNDSSTGLYRPGASVLGITAGGVSTAQFTNGRSYTGAGSLAFPSWSFIGDTDTGFYQFASNTIGISIAGLDAGRFLPSGNTQLGMNDGTVTNPAYSFFNDPDVGFYRTGANVMRMGVGGSPSWQFDTTANTSFLPIRAGDGSQSTPTFSFDNDPDIGMYRVGANQLGFSTGGVLSLLITSTGEVLSSQNGSEGTPTFSFNGDPDTGMYRPGGNTLGFSAGGLLGLVIDSARRVYGTSLHNNASAPTGATNHYLASGTYTPILTNVANLASSSASECQWMRVGNVVTVSGRALVDPTAAAQTNLGISLPLASTLSSTTDCAGCGNPATVTDNGAGITADTANNRAEMFWIAVDLSSHNIYFTFTYEIK